MRREARAPDSAMLNDLSKTARFPSTRSTSAARRTQFVAEYLIHHNGTRAAMAAGYSARSAKQLASQLLRDDRVKELVVEGEKTLLATAALSAQNVLEVIRCHLMRDISQFVREDDGQFKALNELTPEQIQIIDTIVRNADGTTTYRIESLYKWAKLAAQHFSLLTERVEMDDSRHIEDKLIEARERAVKAGHAKKYPDGGKAT